MYILWCIGCRTSTRTSSGHAVRFFCLLTVAFQCSHVFIITVTIAESLNACFCTWDNLRKKPTFHDNTVVSPQSDIWETSAEIPYWWCATTQISVLSASDWLEICVIHYCNQIAVSVIMMSQLFQVNKSCNIKRQKWVTNFVHCSVSCYYWEDWVINNTSCVSFTDCKCNSYFKPGRPWSGHWDFGQKPTPHKFKNTLVFTQWCHRECWTPQHESKFLNVASQ